MTDEGDRFFGRGTTEMKGFLASALALAERAKLAKLNAPLSLSISYDDEIGCVGTRQMMPEMKDFIKKPVLIVVGEPTSMKVATGHKGKAALNVTCRGEAGHSALALQFVNAIHVASRFVHLIRVLRDQIAEGPRNDGFGILYSNVHIGKTTGGRALKIVPDSTQLDLEFRHLPETPAQDIQRKIEAAAQKVSAEFPAAQPVSVEAINSYPGLNTDPSGAVVARADILAEKSGATKCPSGKRPDFSQTQV